MLTRQKIILLLLEYANRPIEVAELVEWCIQIRYEADSQGGGTFYDFVPYQGRLISFTLLREIEKLELLGLFCLVGERTIVLNSKLAALSLQIPAKIDREIRAIAQDPGYGHASAFSSCRDYHHSPFVTGRLRGTETFQAKTDIAVYTAGYEGVSIEGFLKLLVEAGIERLIDVRNNPIARRYGFHKSTLNRLLEKLGIEYDHFAELGIPSEFRKRFLGDSDRKSMFNEYEDVTLVGEADAVTAVSRKVAERATVLVCMEADPVCCHRSRLARLVSKKTGLPTVNLGSLPWMKQPSRQKS